MMKEETVLNILMYLFKNHLQGSYELDANLFDELESAGFSKNAIHHAFKWLENLADQVNQDIQYSNPSAIRTLSSTEQSLLSQKAQDYIHYLRRENILSNTSTELVLNQLTELNPKDIDISLIQWVTLMVLYNQADQSEALEKMEFLVLHDKADALH